MEPIEAGTNRTGIGIGVCHNLSRLARSCPPLSVGCVGRVPDLYHAAGVPSPVGPPRAVYLSTFEPADPGFLFGGLFFSLGSFSISCFSFKKRIHFVIPIGCSEKDRGT